MPSHNERRRLFSALTFSDALKQAHLVNNDAIERSLSEVILDNAT